MDSSTSRGRDDTDFGVLADELGCLGISRRSGRVTRTSVKQLALPH
jgi:hypothetical protein